MTLRARIPKKTIEQARRFADQVYEARGLNPDKFQRGDEHAADVRGFEVEFAHAYAYGLPYPTLKKGKEVDKGYDCFMALERNGTLVKLKTDIKASPQLLVNQDQYKKAKTNIYLFENMQFLNWERDIMYLQIHGWIYHHEVPEHSQLIPFKNGSTAYKINKLRLHSPTQLYALTKPIKDVKP